MSVGDGVGETVAGVLIETREHRAAAVAARLAAVPGLSVQAHDGKTRIAAVWVAADPETLVAAAEELLATDAEVLGVFPTFAAQAGAEPPG